MPGGKGQDSYVEIRPRSKKQDDDKKMEDNVELINVGSDSSDSDENHLLLIPEVEIISSDDDC